MISDYFGEEIRPTKLVSLKIDEQISLLQNLLRRSDFICLFNPHITGDHHDETRFAKELVRVAFDRPAPFPSPQIEIHTQPRDSKATFDLDDRLRKSMAHVADSIGPPGGVTASGIRIVFHKKLLDRYMFAGTITRSEDDQPVMIPRWSIHLGHVARADDGSSTTVPTTWALHGKSDTVNIWNCLQGPESKKNILLEKRLGTPEATEQFPDKIKGQITRE
jgi:hypothetical protein